MAKTLVKSATEGPQLASGKFFRPNAVIAVGAMKNEPPKVAAESKSPAGPATIDPAL
jgi:hypothetical protein